MNITELNIDILGLVQREVSEQQNKQKFSSVMKQLTENYDPAYQDDSDEPCWELYYPTGPQECGLHGVLRYKWTGILPEKHQFDFWETYEENYNKQYANSPLWEYEDDEDSD